MPHSRPMSVIGRRCHELGIADEWVTWRVVYRLDPEAIVIGAVFAKKTDQTPKAILDTCRRRFRAYDALMEGER